MNPLTFDLVVMGGRVTSRSTNGDFSLAPIDPTILDALESKLVNFTRDIGNDFEPLGPFNFHYGGQHVNPELERANSTRYVAGEMIHSGAGGFTWENQTTGDSGPTPPSLSTALGSETPDGGCLWRRRGVETSYAGNPPGTVGLGDTDMYYDPPHCAFAIMDFLASRGAAQDLLDLFQQRTLYARNYRKTYYAIQPFYGQVPGFRVFTRGMLDDHTRNADGDQATAQNIRDMVENGLYTRFFGVSYQNGDGFRDRRSREVAYSVEAHCDAERVGMPRLTYAAGDFTSRGYNAPADLSFLAFQIDLIAHHLWDWYSDARWPTDYDPIADAAGGVTTWPGLQPFMVGLSTTALQRWAEWEQDNGTPERIAQYWPANLQSYGIANPWGTWEQAVAAVVGKIRAMQHSSGMAPMMEIDGGGGLQSQLGSGVRVKRNTEFNVGHKVGPDTGAGWFECIEQGFTGPTPPPWDTTTDGAETQDGGARFAYRPNEVPDASAERAPTTLFAISFAIAGHHYALTHQMTAAAEAFADLDRMVRGVKAVLFNGKELCQASKTIFDALAVRALYE